MLPQKYYSCVIDRLKNCYQFYDYFIAAGNELLAEGCDPSFPAIAAPVEQLERFTVQKTLQVHLPIIGEKSQSVLMPIDFEIFIGNENHLLYSDKQALPS